MRDLRSQQTVCFLIGPDQDRQDWAQYFEQAGYQVQVFKNPTVLFDYLKEFKSFVVVLETSALRIKLSQWVADLRDLSANQIWMSLAPISQYPILATYQNRGLKDFISIDQPYFKERTLWALDRQLELFQSQLVPVNKVIPMSQLQVSTFNMETYLELRAREASIKKIPFSILTMQLDDQIEIRNFWGDEVLKKANNLLVSLCEEKWKSANTHKWEDFVLLSLNSSTADLLREIQQLQIQVQTQARELFGFQVSMSAGLSELNIHSENVHTIIKQATDACRNMLLKGGGRVGVPKPLKKDSHGDLPQNLG